jgi:hypothetical protein
MKLAYLDPGSGSILIQAIVGGAAAIGVFFKVFGRRIAAFFRRNKAGNAGTIDLPAEGVASETVDQDVLDRTSDEKVS